MLSPPCPPLDQAQLCRYFHDYSAQERDKRSHSQRQNGQWQPSQATCLEARWNGQAPSGHLQQPPRARRAACASPSHATALPRGHTRLLRRHLLPSLNTPTRPRSARAFVVLVLQQSCKTLRKLNLCDPLFIAVYCVRSCSAAREQDDVLLCHCQRSALISTAMLFRKVCNLSI